jgi:hypothetical protein
VPLYVNTDNGVTMSAEGVEAAILERASNWKRVEVLPPAPVKAKPTKKKV